MSNITTKNKAPDSPNDNSLDGAWQEMAKTAEPFERHIEKNHQEKLQRFMELSGVKRNRENNELFNDSLQKLDRDSAYNYLKRINGILRGVGKKERGRRDDVLVGDHIAPPAPVQGAVLSEVTNALKEINNNKYRAALSYYAINGLHLFPDGNGRTSRAVYEIFENSDFDLSSAESLAHHSENQAYGHQKFEKEKGIKSSSYALGIALNCLKIDLANNKLINPKANEATITVPGIAGVVPDIYLTEDAEEKLSASEKRMINMVFTDSDISTIALNKVLTSKGVFDKLADANTKEENGKKYIEIEVSKRDIDTNAPNKKAHKTFEGWTAKDYRDFLKATFIIQKMQYDKLISIFKTPEEYMLKNGSTIANLLTGE